MSNLVFCAALGAALALTVPDALTGLRDHAAPPIVRIFVVGAYAAWIAVAGLTVVLGLAWYVPALAGLAPLAAVWFGDHLIALAGGPRDLEHLRRAYNSIISRAKTGSTSTEESNRLRREIGRLDRYRTTETAEFIALAKTELMDFVEGRDVDKETALSREQRLVALGNQWWEARHSGRES